MTSKAQPRFEPLAGYEYLAPDEMGRRAEAFEAIMRKRRTVRDFAPNPVRREVIESAIRTAGLAPSGANRQPWHFVVVTEAELKRRIRDAAEKEEKEFYARRAPQEWLDALAELGTTWEKPFLETAPVLIVIFQELYRPKPDSGRVKNYYVLESVGIATGFLIAALHHAGLATLTHTPSPMGFLREILGRPSYEKAAMILVTGYPSKNAVVPAIRKKPLSEIATFR
ncbi:MAG: nitroreductase family protein [Alphaproteobacteria bacterium]